MIEGVRLRVEESDRVQSEQHRNLAERLTREIADLKEHEADARRPPHQNITAVRSDLAAIQGYLRSRDKGHHGGAEAIPTAAVIFKKG